jgi:hypothetical protein
VIGVGEYLVHDCVMALGSTQPPTDMSTKNLLGGKGWLVRKADNLTALREPTV